VVQVLESLYHDMFNRVTFGSSESGMRTRSNGRHQMGRTRRIIRMGAIPVAIYLAIFFVVTYPLLYKFSTHFFANDKDGLVMIWDIWWTNTAVTQLHQSPWHTGYLYYPYGVGLLTHTLCPFNGFLAMALLPFLTLKQAYNFIVILTFVVAGLTTFWLSHHITRAYVPSIVAGFIFSFSNYHFAHTPGHLNLASLEWIPLFVLFWYMFLERPGVLIALASAASLFAVSLCDYYYLFYSLVIAAMMFVWVTLRQRNHIFTKQYVISLSVFVAATLASSGIIIFKISRLMGNTPLHGAHDPSMYPADLLAPFIYGARLRFSYLTRGFWTHLQGNNSEFSVYVGVSVLILVVYAWIRRKKIDKPNFRLWYVLLFFFLLSSLGPTLHVWGKQVPFALMPYRLLDVVFPSLKLSGVPSRMMVIVMLCAAVISAMGLDQLLRGPAKTRVCAVMLLLLLFVEFLPHKMKAFEGTVPEWVYVLRDLPGKEGVIDNRGKPYSAMYYQTIHNKPLWGGFIARIPRRLMEENARINQHVMKRDFETLRDVYGFKYEVSGGGVIYDLSRGEVIYRQK
jgi:hypothetical protein